MIRNVVLFSGELSAYTGKPCGLINRLTKARLRPVPGTLAARVVRI